MGMLDDNVHMQKGVSAWLAAISITPMYCQEQFPLFWRSSTTAVGHLPSRRRRCRLLAASPYFLRRQLNAFFHFVSIVTLCVTVAEQAAALHALGPDYQSTFSAAESSAVLEQAGRAAAAVMEGREALGPRLLAAYNAQVISCSFSVCTTNVVICNISSMLGCHMATAAAPPSTKAQPVHHQRYETGNLTLEWQAEASVQRPTSLDKPSPSQTDLPRPTLPCAGRRGSSPVRHSRHGPAVDRWR